MTTRDALPRAEEIRNSLAWRGDPTRFTLEERAALAVADLIESVLEMDAVVQAARACDREGRIRLSPEYRDLLDALERLDAASEARKVIP